MSKHYNRVRQAVAGAPGTGTVTLGSALPGFSTFAAAHVGNGDVVPYAIEEGVDWEVGLGTYNATAGTLTRASVDNSTGAPISFGANAVVMITPINRSFTEIEANTITTSSLVASDSVTANGDIRASTASGAWLANAVETLRDNRGDKLLTPQAVLVAQTEASLTYAATITPDLNSYLNAKVTLTGNLTLGNPTGMAVGKSGFIRLTQDATGSRTITYGSVWKKGSAESGTLSTAAGAVDILFYTVLSLTEIKYSLSKAIG